MDKQRIIENAKDYVLKLFEGNSGGHDAEHTFRVYRNAMEIAKLEHIDDTFPIALSALLHDADDHKLFCTENNCNARTFLEENGIDLETQDEICRIINSVSFSKNKGRKPSSIQAMIVQDADRLDAIGAIGVARTFAYGGEHGRSISKSVEHFHEKLLLLKGMMNTESAKRLAEKRHAFMLSFLEELDSETR